MSTLSENTKYLVALSHFPKFGPARLKRILANFTDLENAFRAKTSELTNAGIEKPIAEEFVAARNNIDPDSLLERLERENIKIMDLTHNSYPQLLAQIYDPPQILYYRGSMIREEYAIAAVGSRKFSAYGASAVESIVRGLCRQKLTIISGLALGVDSLAHNIVLQEKCRTIAVIGSGLDRQSIYPASNRYLADKIAGTGGAVISEFPLGTPPLKFNFPQRNRVISGLSLGTLVIEAAARSGALITARFAIEQGREVFAVPGSIYSPTSEGPNILISQGAKLVRNAEDIIESLNLQQINDFIKTQEIIPDTDEERLILGSISHEPKYINEIIALTKLDIKIINSTLIIMEMKGMIKNVGNGQYVLGR